MDVSKPVPNTDMVCPFHDKPMRKVCPTCPLWISIRGKNPQSEEIIDRWGCAIEFMPLLMIENSQQQRQTGAAVESFRNEMVRLNEGGVQPELPLGLYLPRRRQ
jgi:hypothetical protein